jgi:hypothetical protein
VAIDFSDPLGRYTKATVELSYEPPDGSPAQTSIATLNAGASSANWTFFRSASDTQGRYRYRVTTFGKDGTTVAGAWQDGIGRQLIVGDRFEGMLAVEVRFVGGVGGDLTASGYQGVLLTLEYPDAPPGTDNVDQRFLTGANVGFTWRVPAARQTPRKYRYEARFVGMDGREVSKTGESKDEVLLIFIPPRG